METEAQLRETFNQVLSDMKIQENFYIDEIYRLKSKTPLMPPSTAVYRPVKVRFLNKFQRSLFLKNLRNLDKFRNIKVTIDCPKALVPDYRIKDKIAYDIHNKSVAYYCPLFMICDETLKCCIKIAIRMVLYLRY